MPRSNTRCGLLLAAVLLAIHAVPADAAVTVTIRGTYLPTGNGTASCAAGEVAVGGGVGTDNPADAYVGRTEPNPNSGTPTGWTGFVHQRSTGNTSTGSVFAICAKGLTATIRGTYLPTGNGTASCAAGEVAVGGGVGTDNPADAYVGRSEPNPNSGTPTGWTGFVRQRSTGNASTGSVFAICAKGITATTRGLYLGSGNGTASCQAGEVLTGGGVGTDNPADAYVGRTEPNPNNGTPTGWTGFVHQRSTGNVSSGSVYAICTKQVVVTPTPTATASPVPTASATATATPVTAATPTPAPTEEPPTIEPGVDLEAKLRIGGAELTLRIGDECVRPGEELVSRLTVRKGRKARLKRIVRIEYYVGNTRVSVDRSAPFSSRFAVRSARAGSTLELEARVRARLRGGKSMMRSLAVRFAICAG